MEYHMAHESIPIAQEKQMVKHIRKLRDSRLRVRQYEELYADVESARASVHSGQGELKEMLEERQVCPDLLSGYALQSMSVQLPPSAFCRRTPYTTTACAFPFIVFRAHSGRVVCMLCIIITL